MSREPPQSFRFGRPELMDDDNNNNIIDHAETDTATVGTNNADTSPPPPPYQDPSDTESDSEDDDEQAAPPRPRPAPVKLTINAAHRIQGSGNAVPVSPNPLVEAARLSMMIAAALSGTTGGPTAAGNPAAAAAHRFVAGAVHPYPQHPRAPLQRVAPHHQHHHHGNARGLDITINCGITIVGDRNLIGPFAVRRPAAATAGTGTGAANVQNANANVPVTPTQAQGPDDPLSKARTLPGDTDGLTAANDRPGPRDVQCDGPDEVLSAGGGVKRKAEEDEISMCEVPMKKVAGVAE